MAVTQTNAPYITQDTITKEPSLAQAQNELQAGLVGAGFRYKPVSHPRYIGGKFRRRSSKGRYRRRSMKGRGFGGRRRFGHKRGKTIMIRVR